MYKNNGFSLIEIILTGALFMVLAAAVFDILFISQKFYQKSQNQAELLQNGKIILERISREIRQASELVTALSQTPEGALSEIEFQDGHLPSPYDYLNSSYYYIKYYLASTTNEIYRQYKVYCFDDCVLCASFFKWNDNKIENGEIIFPHSCILENKVIGEYVRDFKLWGSSLINIDLTLQKINEEIKLKTQIWGRNL